MRGVLGHWLAIAVWGFSLTACGYNTLPIAPYTDPMSGDYGNNVGMGGGGYYSSPGGYGGGFAGGYSPTGPMTGQPSVSPTPPELSLRQVRKQATGALFWKRLKVSGQVVNAQSIALKGELRASFTRNGKVVETQTVLIPDLADGQAKSFALTSKRSCDNVELNVLSEVTVIPAQSGLSYGGIGQTGGNGGYY